MNDDLKECIEIGLREDSNINDLTDFRINNIRKYIGDKHDLYEVDKFYFVCLDVDFSTPIYKLSKLLDEEANEKITKLKYLIISEYVESLMNDNPERFSTLLYYICESIEETTRINELCCKMFTEKVYKLKNISMEKYGVVLYYHFNAHIRQDGLHYSLDVFKESKNSRNIALEVDAIDKELKENGINIEHEGIMYLICEYIFLHGKKLFELADSGCCPSLFYACHTNSDDKLFLGFLCKYLKLDTAYLIKDMFRKHLDNVIRIFNKLQNEKLKHVYNLGYEIVYDGPDISYDQARDIRSKHSKSLIKSIMNEKLKHDGELIIEPNMLVIGDEYERFKQEFGEKIIPISDDFATKIIEGFITSHLMVGCNEPILPKYINNVSTKDLINELYDKHLGDLVNKIKLDIKCDTNFGTAYVKFNLSLGKEE